MPRQRVQQSRLKSVTLPAPTGGLNTLSAASAMPPEDCMVLWNMVAAEYGLRSRLGWKEWVTGLNGEQVRTILPFTGSLKDGSKNKLFAATTSGIWDVTASTTTPTKVVTFGTTNTDSGYGASTAFVTIAGFYLVYADEANGAYLYSQTSNTWTQFSYNANPTSPGQVSGQNNSVNVNPALFAHVVSWKNMLWFTERDTGRAWYLPVGQLAGTANAFTFGNKFQAGGDLRGLWSWTGDGGSGLDDALVAVSGGGDLLVYKGIDPTQASGFSLSGVWQIGAVPAGRRLCSALGGDLLVMCSLGILSLSKLSTGAAISQTTYETAKVGNLFNQLQAATSTLRGWAIHLHPADNTIILLVPQSSGQPTQQLVMSMWNRSWSRYRGMPMGIAAAAWGGTLYFGTEDGRVCINDGYLDGVLLNNTPGSPIDYSLISGFQSLGTPNQKRIQLVRPTFLSQGAPPTYSAGARYRWDLTEGVAPAGSTNTNTALWDSATWATDSATSPVFEGDYSAQQGVFGAQGMGPQAAVVIRGTASARTILVGADVFYDEGGPL